MRAVASALVAGLIALTLAEVARADDAPAGAGPRAEAGERFDRALRLASENDNAAALAEFKRVYELVPNPVVLYNIGLVYAAMNRPVEAVDAMDRLTAAPGSLSADRVARARAVRNEQAARIAQVTVAVNVEGASIEIDGVEVAKAPLAKPLPIASGTHVVGAVAEGHAPSRKEVTVAGRMTAPVTIELLPMAGRLAHLAIRTHLPGASVVVDGAVVGRTPLAASITMPPGAHQVELTRAGYVTARRDITLGDGATGEVALDPEEDRAALETEGGTLALAISQQQALVTVDGRPRGVYTGSLHLARGPHRLHIDRGGFLPYERDVDVTKGAVTNVAIELFPTADTLVAYSANARFRRNAGWATALGGVLAIGAGAVVLGVDAGQRSHQKATYEALEHDLGQLVSPCASTDPAEQCNARIHAAHDSYQSAQSRDALGFVLGGVGLAAIGVGAYLVFGADDPHRYDRKPAGGLFAGLPAIDVAPARGGGVLGLRGSF